MPQPIDPQSELGRVTAAERIQQIADRASLAAQSRIAAEAGEERANAETAVRQMNQKSEEVDEETRRKNPFTGRRRKKRQGTVENAADPVVYAPTDKRDAGDDPDGHTLDVTI